MPCRLLHGRNKKSLGRVFKVYDYSFRANCLQIFKEIASAGCNVLICDFQREQTWDRCLKKKVKGCSADRLKILSLLRSIARSETFEVRISSS